MKQNLKLNILISYHSKLQTYIIYAIVSLIHGILNPNYITILYNTNGKTFTSEMYLFYFSLVLKWFYIPKYYIFR